jgi:PTH1 family peptidyl-tRNA hydrolase
MKLRRKIVVGLGNPGKEYAGTFHNVGVLAMETLAALSGEWAGGAPPLFVAPTTFMNESGGAVRAAMKKFGARPEDLIVLHDESDLPLGDYKTSFGKNSAGHKGVQSIIDALGTKEFTRIRIGIRPPQERHRTKASSFVLKMIGARDRKILDGVFEKIAGAVASEMDPNVKQEAA